MGKTHTIEELKTAIKNLLIARGEVWDMANEWHDKTLDHPGVYLGLSINPETGNWSTHLSPSWECSANEYFSEDGILSINTLKRGNTGYGSPGPEDGYEWDDDENGEYVRDDHYGWSTYDNVIRKFGDKDEREFGENEDKEELITRKGLTRFTVSNHLVDNDVISDLACEFEKKIDELIGEIESEIERHEEKEE